MKNEFEFMEEVEQVEVSPDFGDDRDGLSPRLKEFEELIGLESTLLMVVHFGGTMLSIPRDAKEGQVIAAAVGLAAATKLSGYCGGEQMEIPLAANYRRLKRDHEIYRLKKSGMPANRLAQKFKMARRHVYEIITRENRRIALRKYSRSMQGRG